MRPQRTFIIIAALTIIAGLAVSFPGGRTVFEREHCLGCHRFRDSGGMIGPDLSGVSKRHSVFWIAAQIRDPKRHNPDSRMPAYPHLGGCERFAIALYLSF